MPLYFFKNITEKLDNSNYQYLTLVIPLAKLTKKKEEKLKFLQKEFTECVKFFLKETQRINTTSPYKLHKLYYKAAREKFKLTAMLIQTARDRAIAIQRIYWVRLKNGKHASKPHITSLLPLHFRQDSYALIRTSRGNWMIRFASGPGRKEYLSLPIVVRPYILQYLNKTFIPGAMEIYRKYKKWLISLSIKIPYHLKIFENIIGVDLGIRHPAVLSNGKFFSGKPFRYIRYKQYRNKFILKTKKRKRKEHYQITYLNHLISKQIIQIALKEKANLSLENLIGIKERLVKRGEISPLLLSNWPYKQIFDFIRYKANLAGIKVVTVNPSGTSITCSKCGYSDENNRINQCIFKCKNCGFELNADLNAARNIAKKGAELLRSS